MKISIRKLKRLIREALDEDEFAQAQTIEFDQKDIIDAMKLAARNRLGLDENTYYKTRYSFSAPMYGGEGGITLKMSFVPMSNVTQLKKKR